jgi:peptide/nickel transport system substrate-binding protein
MKKSIGAALLALTVAGTAALVSAQGRNNVFVYGGNWSDLITLDPGQSYEFSGGLITDNMYQTLVKFEGEDISTLKPSAAINWGVKDAGDSWKIKFKLGLSKFSSGRRLTAADVVYTFDRAIALKGNGSFLFTDVANIKVGSTKALDSSTVEITLPKTASPAAFLNVLTFNIGGIVDSEEVKKHEAGGDFGSAWLKTNSAGSGPYQLNKWDQGSQVILDINKNSTIKGKVQRVILRNIEEANAQKIALESGEIDVAEDLSPDMVKEKAKDAKFSVYKADTLRIQYLGMNSGEDGLFKDARVRQAVRWALDQDAMVNDLAGGNAKKIQTIIPFGLFGANPATPYKLDVEKGKALMAAAGKSAGFEVEFLVPTGSCAAGIPCADLATKVQSDLAKIGIKANIKQIVQAELLKIYRAQKAQFVLLQWGSDFPDPDGNATPFGDFNAKSLAWRNQWKNDASSKLVQQAALEKNPTKRAALYKQLTELHLQEGWGAMLMQPTAPITISKSVSGYQRNAQGQVRFEKISKQ